MTHLDLFSGIGGFAIAAERVWPDIEHVFCDNEPFAQAILRKHWPESKIYGDIREIKNTGQHGEIDIITGGFPCQPASQAGLRKGTSDARWLWPEMYRVIREFSPRYVVAENVRGLLSLGGGLEFEKICLDLEALGYEIQPLIIPAVAVGAPHRRDRVWIVAHATGERDRGGASQKRGVQKRELEPTEPQGRALRRQGKGRDRVDEPIADPGDARLQGRKQNGTGHRGFPDRARSNERASWNQDWTKIAARLCRMDDGLPRGIPRPRGWRNAAIKAYGNAIVPDVAEQILRAIHTSEMVQSL